MCLFFDSFSFPFFLSALISFCVLLSVLCLRSVLPYLVPVLAVPILLHLPVSIRHSHTKPLATKKRSLAISRVRLARRVWKWQTKTTAKSPSRIAHLATSSEMNLVLLSLRRFNKYDRHFYRLITFKARLFLIDYRTTKKCGWLQAV